MRSERRLRRGTLRLPLNAVETDCTILTATHAPYSARDGNEEEIETRPDRREDDEELGTSGR